jgi:hypothetical protein
MGPFRPQRQNTQVLRFAQDDKVILCRELTGRDAIPFSQLVRNWLLAVPQGLKPAFLLALGGTSELVPFPKPE